MAKEKKLQTVESDEEVESFVILILPRHDSYFNNIRPRREDPPLSFVLPTNFVAPQGGCSLGYLGVPMAHVLVLEAAVERN